ncbi:hypothetical protein OSTOST_20053, partial [Ostertagia ostertagi]
MYAYRITEIRNGREIRVHDCFDDGETGASSKMLELLDKMNATNVLRTKGDVMAPLISCDQKMHKLTKDSIAPEYNIKGSEKACNKSEKPGQTSQICG